MSIRFPDTNINHPGDTGGDMRRLNFPSGALDKGTATGFVFGFWYQSPPQGPTDDGGNPNKYIFTRGAGLSGGSDGYLRFNSSGTVTYQDRLGGNDVVNFSGGSVPDYTPTLILLIATSTDFHIATCEVGGTATISTDTGNSDPYNDAASQGAMFDAIGGGTNSSSYPFVGAIENVFFTTGNPPTVDAASVEDIANGVTPIADIITSGLRFHYPLLHKADFADVSGSVGDLTINSPEEPERGIQFLTGGQFRPATLAPTKVGHYGANLKLTAIRTFENMTADVKFEGGTFDSGLGPAEIQGRLVKEDRSVHLDWTTLDAAPGSTSWAEATVLDVPATTGVLMKEFRAVDGGGSQIGDIVPSNGLTGTGTTIVIQLGQSQAEQGFTVKGNVGSLDQGVRFVTLKNGAFEAINSSASVQDRAYGRMMTTYANEINNVLPNYPIFFSTITKGGSDLHEYLPGGPFYNRWQFVANYLGMKYDDNFIMFFGYLDTPTNYSAKIKAAYAEHERIIGTPRKAIYIQMPLQSTSEPIEYTRAVETHQKYREVIAENPGGWIRGPSMNNVEPDGLGSPHPSTTDKGHGRSGSQMAGAVLTAIGAIEGPLEYKSASASGTTATVKLGPVNDAFLAPTPPSPPVETITERGEVLDSDTNWTASDSVDISTIGLVEGDVILAMYSLCHNTTVNPNFTAPSGESYTKNRVNERSNGSGAWANARFGHKTSGATPNSTIDLVAQTQGGRGEVLGVRGYENVETVEMFVNSNDTLTAVPPSVTPTKDNSMVVVMITVTNGQGVDAVDETGYGTNANKVSSGGGFQAQTVVAEFTAPTANEQFTPDTLSIGAGATDRAWIAVSFLLTPLTDTTIAPTNITSPSISGTVAPGETITIVTGTYTGEPAVTTPIPGTLTLDGADVTGDMSGMSYDIPLGTSGQVLEWSETASNGVSPDATQSVSDTVA